MCAGIFENDSSKQHSGEREYRWRPGRWFLALVGKVVCDSGESRGTEKQAQ
jgi:hypothetical protein